MIGTRDKVFAFLFTIWFVQVLATKSAVAIDRMQDKLYCLIYPTRRDEGHTTSCSIHSVLPSLTSNRNSNIDEVQISDVQKRLHY